MAHEIIMPKQGQSVESCILTTWYKRKGDQVNKGDLLFSYETDKASFDEEAPEDGFILDTFFAEGDEVPVLKVVAVIGEKDGSYTLAEEPEISSHEEIREEETVAFNGNQFLQSAADNNGVAISPRARHLANTRNIDYHLVKGTGPYGRIIERDIAALGASSKITPLARKIAEIEKIVPPRSGTGFNGKILANDIKGVHNSGEFAVKELSNMRKIIAKRMLESLQNTAQLTLHRSADARNILALRKEFKAKNENITINDLVCYAIVQALLKFPDINAHLQEEKLKVFKHIHLGIAVDTSRGLMVPTVRNADYLSLSGLAAAIKEIAAKCQQGNIDPELLEGGSFTITNLGAFGIENFTPVLNAPQVAILGVGNISLKPIESTGGFSFIPHISLSLTFDHRATDGAEGARFLQEVDHQLQTINTKK